MIASTDIQHIVHLKRGEIEERVDQVRIRFIFASLETESAFLSEEVVLQGFSSLGELVIRDN